MHQIALIYLSAFCQVLVLHAGDWAVVVAVFVIFAVVVVIVFVDIAAYSSLQGRRFLDIFHFFFRVFVHR